MKRTVSTQLGTKPRASREERRAAGKALRTHAPRRSHAAWTVDPRRPSPLETLHRDDKGRVRELVPIRYARMMQSPFAFFRGAASVMARDLSTTPVTGLTSQICGDAHLSNFGGFATPERNLVFDINDFDETNPGPWEWDVKRLAASIVVAGRSIGLKKAEIADATLACLRSYRERMSEYAEMKTLDVWYTQLERKALEASLKPSQDERKRLGEIVKKGTQNTVERVFPKLTAKGRFIDQPPLIFHPKAGPTIKNVRASLARYRLTLSADRRDLLDRYTPVDLAFKVVGVGSVGRYCLICLLLADATDPLILQVKEARASVLEPYVGRSVFRSHGERVVTGQRLMQGASDLFLGWFRNNVPGTDMYVRQLRDMKTSVEVETMTAEALSKYVAACGWALARAHAKAGSIAPEIAGYLGSGDAFDTAVLEFANAYADQNELDHQLLVKAVRAGRIATRKA